MDDWGFFPCFFRVIPWQIVLRTLDDFCLMGDIASIDGLTLLHFPP